MPESTAISRELHHVRGHDPMLCKLAPLQEIAITHVGGKIAHDRLVDAPTLKHIQSVLQRFLSTIVRA